MAKLEGRFFAAEREEPSERRNEARARWGWPWAAEGSRVYRRSVPAAMAEDYWDWEE